MTEIREMKIPFPKNPITGEISLPPPAETCSFCGKILEARGCPHPIEERLVSWMNRDECDCEGAENERKEWKRYAEMEQERRRIENERRAEEKAVEKCYIDSGMGQRAKINTFEKFVVGDGNRRAYNSCKKFAANFYEYRKKGTSMVLYGEMGTGKTHLANAVVNELVKLKYNVKFGTLISILEKLKKSFGEEKDEWTFIDSILKCDLLIIDDLGKEKPSEWALDRLFHIINERYDNFKCILITTNMGEDALIKALSTANNSHTAKAVVSRIFHICSGIELAGEDWRRK